MAFTNRIRLPFKLHKPQFAEERQEYRKANGVTVTLSVVIRKVYEALTDSMPEKLHERLKIALAHDNVVIEGHKYIGIITQEGDYQIEWIDFLDKPIAQGKFKANVVPFNATNSNCGTCEEYSQVVTNDDDAGTLDEDTEYDIDVLANDDICCSPVTISIVTSNSSFVDSISVNPDNTLHIKIKASVPDANSVIIATYRAQCANGLFDDANVIANINGTDPTPVCLAPTDPVWDGSPNDTTAQFSWTAPSPVPACDYHWEVRTALGAVIASGDEATTTVIVTGLPSNTSNLRFFVRSNCCSLDSNYAGPVIFSLPPPNGTDTCGSYRLSNTDVADFHIANYMDCNGDQQFLNIAPLHSRDICALQSSPGNPIDIATDFEISVTYLGLC